MSADGTFLCNWIGWATYLHELDMMSCQRLIPESYLMLENLLGKLDRTTKSITASECEVHISDAFWQMAFRHWYTLLIPVSGMWHVIYICNVHNNISLFIKDSQPPISA